MLFILSEKVFLFSRYLNFCLDISVMQKKWLDETDKFNFEIDDGTTWFKNNYSTHIARVNRIQQEKYFTSKIMQKQTSLFFFKKHYIKKKNKWSAAWSHYIKIALKLAYNKNKLHKTLKLWIQR